MGRSKGSVRERQIVPANADQANRAAPADPAQEALARQARRRRRWALAAMLFPLLFATVIAVGLAAMFFKRMEIFRPAHSSAGAPPCYTRLIHPGAIPQQFAQV